MHEMIISASDIGKYIEISVFDFSGFPCQTNVTENFQRINGFERITFSHSQSVKMSQLKRLTKPDGNKMTQWSQVSQLISP